MRKLPTSSLRCDYNNLLMIYFLFSSSVDQNNFLNKDGHELFIAHMNKCFFIKIIIYDACYCFWTNFKGAFNNYVRGILANFDPRSLMWTKKNTIHLWHYRLWSFKSRDEKLEVASNYPNSLTLVFFERKIKIINFKNFASEAPH